ncbi:hypothetical protein JHK85_056588 [Glycine max]|nr:hypothetical protein JHK85_056588 [Glycine max]
MVEKTKGRKEEVVTLKYTINLAPQAPPWLKGRNQGRVTEALTYMTSPQHCSAGGDDRQHVDRVAKGNIKGGVKGTCVLLHIRGKA